VSLVVAPRAEALTGAEWLRLAPAARAAYVSGILDAWEGLVGVQESLGSKDRAITVFADVVGCIRERPLSPADVLALVDKYTDDNPGLRTKDMADIVFAVVTQACARGG
jgi:hypothetical protein